MHVVDLDVDLDDLETDQRADRTSDGGTDVVCDDLHRRRVLNDDGDVGGGARALGAIRNVVNADDKSQGVKVEVGETQAAADITIVVEYPMPVQDVASNVRAAVSGAISQLVGLEVVEVNVEVNDVHLPSDDKDEEESRVS